MGKTRTTGNLVSENILSVDITNDYVGVGTTQPGYKLDVNGDINFTGIFRQNGSQFVASRWTAGNGDDIYRLSGNIGIGTTLATNTLTVVGSGTSTSQLFVTGVSTLGITTTTSLSATQLSVSGVSTLGITTTTDLTAQQLNVSGISTLGVTTTTSLSATQLSVSGVVTATTIDSSTFKNYAETAVNLGTLSGTSAANNIGLSTGNIFYGTLPTSGITTFTFTTGLTSGAVSFTLYLKNGASGNPTLSWPASVLFSGGSAPDRTTIANKTDIWTFSTLDNGTYWYGDIAMYNL